MDLKKEIRKEVRCRIKLIGDEQRLSTSKQIFDYIASQDAFAKAQCIALFAAMGDEVPTRYALDGWLKAGKRLVVPRVEGDVMNFYRYDGGAMAVGAFGINEPQMGEAVQHCAIGAIIVPGVAFTADGARMGRGKGFYDSCLLYTSPSPRDCS